MAVGRDVIKRGVRRRVFSGIECLRNFASGGTGLGDQCIDQRRFAHAGLTDEHAGLARKPRTQIFCVVAGGEFDHGIAEAAEHRDTLAGLGQAFAQVGLVEQDQRLDFLAFRSEQGAGDQFVGEARFGGDDDDQLVDVGGDQLLADFIGAVKQAGARQDGLDHTLVVGAALDLHPVATGDLAFLAPREAGEQAAIGKFDNILPAMGGDDTTLHQRQAPVWVAGRDMLSP